MFKGAYGRFAIKFDTFMIHIAAKSHINYNMECKKEYFIFCLAGFLFTCVVGTFSHFFYQWAGSSSWAALLFPVNESTWEHLKLVFFSVFLYFTVGFFFMKDASNYLAAAFLCMLTAVVLIPAIFYSYTAITGKSILVVDILTFFVAVLAGFVVAYFVLNASPKTALNVLSAAGLTVFLMLYLTLTFYPPQCFLFKDPVSGGYGIIR